MNIREAKTIEDLHRAEAEMTIDESLWRMPDDLYFSGPGLSHSTLWRWQKNPLKYQYEQQHNVDHISSRDMLFGHFFERVVNHDFDGYKVLASVPQRRSNADKEWWTEVEESGVNVHSLDEFKTAARMAHWIRSQYPDLILRSLHRAGQSQVVGYRYATDRETGKQYLMRAKADYLTIDRIIDLKTTSDSSDRGWFKSCGEYGYHWQAAWYLEVFSHHLPELKDFDFIVQEKSPPYEAKLRSIAVQDLINALNQIKQTVSLYLSGPKMRCTSRIVQELPSWI